MAVTPDTEIRLIKSNLDLDENNQINFSNATAQYNYFNSLTHTSITGASYQRKDNYIRYPAHIDSIIEYNYCMYKNTHYKNKWFYAYITRMEYENDNCTRVYLKTDVFQTWQFDLTYKRSFVEREHVNSDTIGEHTIPEGLETGEFIINSNPTYIAHYSSSGGDNAGEDSYVVLSVTDFADPGVSNTDRIEHRIVNGIFNGCIYLVATGSTPTEVATKLNTYFTWYAGKLDYIQSIFTVPKNLLYFNNTTQLDIVTDGDSGHTYSCIKPSNGSYRFIDDVTITINSTINGYTPKNKKLFTREYNNILVSNQAGTDVVMAYEDFISHTPKFTAVGTISPGCSVKLVPLNYKLLADSATSKRCYDFGIVGPKYPVCSWVGDTFTNWLTQNGVNLAVQSVSSIGTAIVGTGLLATGAGTAVGAGMLAGGIMGIANTLSTVYQHNVAPEQTMGNVSAGDVTWSDGKALFTVYQMCIRQEYAKIIDNFFSMYGYKVNTLKVPNITGRSNWNYVKLINPNIEGFIPQEDLQEIKRMFTNGITIWHNTANFLDYSQSNNIV